MRMPKNCCRKSQELVIDRSAKLAIVATSHPSAARSGRIFYRLKHLPRRLASPPGRICCRLFRLRNVDLKRWLPPELRLQPQTTNIYNDYIVNLSRLETGWWACRGLNVSDIALFGKEILVACPNRGAACGRSRGGEIAPLIQEMHAFAAMHSATSL